MESFGSASEKSSEKQLYKTTKNLQYIMKFVIRSRILFAKLNDDRDQNMFEASLEGEFYIMLAQLINLDFILFFHELFSFVIDLLQSFIKLTACPNDLLRSQGAMLKYLHVISSDLTQVYDAIKLRFALHFKTIFIFGFNFYLLFFSHPLSIAVK